MDHNIETYDVEAANEMVVSGTSTAPNEDQNMAPARTLEHVCGRSQQESVYPGAVAVSGVGMALQGDEVRPVYFLSRHEL